MTWGEPAGRDAAVYLDLVGLVEELVARPELAAQWNAASALAEYTCGALAGHVARSLLVVTTALDDAAAADSAGAAQAVDAAEYFVAALGDADPITAPVHQGVRARSAALAGGSAEALRARVAELAARVRAELPRHGLDELVPVFGGQTMRLREFLCTRAVEITVHADDLAVSLGIATPALPDGAAATAVAVLAEVARRRHGDAAVLRLLARRERADDATRAF